MFHSAFSILIALNLATPTPTTVSPAPKTEKPVDLADRDIQEVNVQGERLERLSTSTEVDLSIIEPAQVQDLANAFALLPSVNIRTNSRGEAQVFIRGATERETAINWRGLPLLVPFDNRFDLGLLPAGATGSISARFAGAAYEADPRAVAASLSINPVQSGGRLNAAVGSSLFRSLDLTLNAGDGVASFSYLGREAEPLAGNLDFSQENQNRRTNTQRDLISASFTQNLSIGASGLELSALVAHASRGVAPESDRNPEEERVRFWRYPASTYALVGATLISDIDTVDITAQLWGQQFNQRINSFTDETFTTLESRENDFNSSIGGIVEATASYGSFEFGAYVRSRFIDHRKNEADVGERPSQESFDELSASFGGDITFVGSESLYLAVYAGLDHIDPGTEVGRLARDSFTAGYFSIEAEKIFGKFSMLASFGQKQRAPTLRELFGTALGRFLANPELAPEKTQIAELTARWLTNGFDGKVTVFARSSERALDQISIPQPVGGSLRQRVNTDGFDLIGVESVVSFDISSELAFSNQLTWTHARPDIPIADGPNRLSERPTWIGRATLSYTADNTALPDGFFSQLDIDWRGRAFSPAADGILTPLSGAALVGGFVSMPIRIKNQPLKFYARLDNLFDVTLFPQAGLPMPGRTFRLGITAQL